MSQSQQNTENKNLIPIIDRMIAAFDALAHKDASMSIRDLCLKLDVPRSTMYRLLNSLESYDLVRKHSDSTYSLGPKFIELSGFVEHDLTGNILSELATPVLAILSKETSEGSRISIIDQNSTLVLAVGRGTSQFSLTVTPGDRLPLHAGASSKLLLAHVESEDRKALLPAELEKFTDHTITDNNRLLQELEEIRALGVSFDKREYSPNVEGIAMPVSDSQGRLICAISVSFLAGKYQSDYSSLLASLGKAARNLSEVVRQQS